MARPMRDLEPARPNAPTTRPGGALARLCRAAAAAALVASTALAGTPSARATWGPAGAIPDLGAGRIWSVAFSPANPSLVLAGTDTGVFRSGDGGQSWGATPLTRVRVWAVGFDARNPSVAYAGTAGRGVWRSVDAGGTWSDDSSGLGNLTVRCLAFGLDGVAAGTDAGVALSADGTTWRGAGPGDPLHGYSISSVAVAANSPQLTVIAGADSGDLDRGYLFRTTASGAWEPLKAGLPSSTVVSSVAAGPITQSVTRRPLVVNTASGTFRSGDGGSSWTESSGIPKDPTTVTLTTSTFSPLDPNLVYSAADSGGSGGGVLMRSTDGGASFAPADQGLPDSTRNVAAIAVAASSPPALIAALDPPSGGRFFGERDGSAPSAPATVTEGTGAVPTIALSAVPTPPARAPEATPPPAPSRPGPVVSFLGAVFHWPTPLIFELPLAALIVLVGLRWKQRYLIDVEGPP